MPRRFWRVCLANFCFFLAYYLVMPAFPLASLAVGAGPGQMGDVLGLAGALQILVAIFLVGPAIDGGRRRPFLLASAGVYGGVALALTQVHSLLPFVLVGARAQTRRSPPHAAGQALRMPSGRRLTQRSTSSAA